MEHPEDWAPVALSGHRASGYARLASPKLLSVQLRWAPLGKSHLSVPLGRYLDRLSADARRVKQPFSRDVDDLGDCLRYRTRGARDADGVIFPTADGRVAFLEAIGDSNTARTRALERVRASFVTGASPEPWSVMGLSFHLPYPVRVEAKEFLAGRTTLKLAGKGAAIVAERWGLAENLLNKRSLDDWAVSRLGGRWKADDGPDRMLEWQASRSSPFGFETALVRHQPDRNQITLLRVRARNPRWRPQWDWLT